jgi:hypothetical protein
VLELWSVSVTITPQIKISIKKKKKKKVRRKPVDYDYQSINKKKIARIFNIIGVIHITFQYK